MHTAWARTEFDDDRTLMGHLRRCLWCLLDNEQLEYVGGGGGGGGGRRTSDTKTLRI